MIRAQRRLASLFFRWVTTFGIRRRINISRTDYRWFRNIITRNSAFNPDNLILPDPYQSWTLKISVVTAIKAAHKLYIYWHEPHHFRQLLSSVNIIGVNIPSWRLISSQNGATLSKLAFICSIRQKWLQRSRAYFLNLVVRKELIYSYSSEVGSSICSWQ